MLHPDQFAVNEAWIAFQLNDAPIRTEQDGTFNGLALMDVASCVILGTEFVAASEEDASQLEIRRLVNKHAMVFKNASAAAVEPADGDKLTVHLVHRIPGRGRRADDEAGEALFQLQADPDHLARIRGTAVLHGATASSERGQSGSDRGRVT